MLQHRVETLAEKKLIGMQMRMSFANHHSFLLWKSFMPRRKEILNNIGNELYSLEVYDSDFFKAYKPENEFMKWAAVEVTDFNAVPSEMETLIIPSGLYAVFIFKGLGIHAAEFYKTIFMHWLPTSNFVLDNRPHFAVMGEKYKRDDADSEEEIWIPVCPK